MTPTGTNATAPGIWVVLATYNDAENLDEIARRILVSMPASRILIVDDASPDGTGLIADTLAANDTRIEVLHRATTEGLGRAWLAGFSEVLARGGDIIVQMDADGSYDPATLWQLTLPIAAGRADLVIGSRYVGGGTIIDWGWRHRLATRVGSVCARALLGVPVHDLTGAYRSWRSSTAGAISPEGISAGGPVFEIEMTSRALEGGARVTEVPVIFRGRRFGGSRFHSPMLRETCLLVLRLGVERLTRRRPAETPVP